MKISTETNSARKLIGNEKAIEYIAKAGFDAFDFTMVDIAYPVNWATKEVKIGDTPLAGPDYLKYIRSIKKVADDNGIICNQTHSVYPTQFPEIERYIRRTIECTAELGAKICVVHPLSLSPVKDNVNYFLDLLPFAKDYGVTIATENMWDWNSAKDHAKPAACTPHSEFASLLNAVNDDYLCACVDIGHAEMRGVETTAADMIRALGSKVKALHIHDNDLHKDLHALPFTMDIDFDKVVKALKDINYDGYFTLEADSHLTKYTCDNAFEGIKKMQAAARRLADMFEAL